MQKIIVEPSARRFKLQRTCAHRILEGLYQRMHWVRYGFTAASTHTVIVTVMAVEISFYSGPFYSGLWHLHETWHGMWPVVDYLAYHRPVVLKTRLRPV